MSYYGGSRRLGHHAQRNNSNYNHNDNQNSRESHTSQVQDKEMRPARETDKWPSKEHEKFCDLMMKQWTQAQALAEPYRRTPADVFAEVSKQMATAGYQRDEEDCALYWHHVARHEDFFKYSLVYPDPPPRTNGRLSHLVQVDPSPPPTSKVHQALPTNQPARTGPPRTSVDVRAVAKRAVQLMHEKAYVEDNRPGMVGSLSINIPDELVGLMVGYKGATVTEIEKSIGCHIVTANPNQCVNHLRPVVIYGSLEATRQARDRISGIISSVYEDNVYTKEKVYPNDKVYPKDRVHLNENDVITVPQGMIKHITGPHNITIDNLRRTSGCTRIDFEAKVGNGLRCISLVGSLNEIALAKRLITEIIESESHANVQQTTTSAKDNAIPTGPRNGNTRPAKTSEQRRETPPISSDRQKINPDGNNTNAANSSAIPTGPGNRFMRPSNTREQGREILASSRDRQNVKQGFNDTTASDSSKRDPSHTTTPDVPSCIQLPQNKEPLPTTNSDVIRNQKLRSTDSTHSTGLANGAHIQNKKTTPTKDTSSAHPETSTPKRSKPTGFTKTFQSLDPKNATPTQPTVSANSTRFSNSKMVTSDQSTTTASKKIHCPLDPTTAALLQSKSTGAPKSSQSLRLETATPKQSKDAAPTQSNQPANSRTVAASQSNMTPSKFTSSQPSLLTSNLPNSGDSDSDDCVIINTQPNTVSRPPPVPKGPVQPSRASNNQAASSVQADPRPRADNPPIPRPGAANPPTSRPVADNSPIPRPRTADPNGWSVREIRVLHEAVEARRQDEFAKHHSQTRLAINDDQFWVHMSRRVDEAGFKRSAEACRTEWEKSFHSPYGLIVTKLDEPDEAEHEANINRYMAAQEDRGTPIAGYEKPVNGPWSTQEKWDVDELMQQYKNVSFTQEGAREHLNIGVVTWEGITQLHNKAGYSRSTASLMKMWNDVRDRKTALPPVLKNRVTKRLHPNDSDNGEGSSKRPRHGQGPVGQSESLNREFFEKKLAKLRQEIADVEKKEVANEKKVDESKEKLAELELQKQAVLSQMNKDVDEGAGYTAEKNKLKDNLAAMHTTMDMFFK